MAFMPSVACNIFSLQFSVFAFGVCVWHGHGQALGLGLLSLPACNKLLSSALCPDGEGHKVLALPMQQGGVAALQPACFAPSAAVMT